MRKYILYIALLLFVSSCEKEINFQFNPEQKACVNCILNPDSTVHLSLCYNRGYGATNDFEPIPGATITILENNVIWGTGTTDETGNFYLNKKPEEGKTYSLTIDGDGLPQLTANTTVQEKPALSYKVLSKEKYYGFYQLDIEINLQDQLGDDHYWNYTLGWYEPWKKYNFSSQVNLISPYIDDFNRVIEAESTNGFYYQYYARIADNSFDGQQITLLKRSTTQGKDVFFNVDEHFDKYMKSSIQQKMIDDDHLPFAEPVQIYSNIKNGTGIFGSASFTTLSYRNE